MRAIPRRLLTVLCCGVLLVLGAGGASAHPLGLPAFARVSLSAPGTVVVTWNAAPDDVAALARSLGVPVAEDELLTPEQDAALARSPALHRALREHITLNQAGRACRATVVTQPPSAAGVRLRFTCPDPVERVRLRLTLLSDLDPRYRTIAVIAAPGGDRRVLFSATRPEHVVALDPAGGEAGRPAAGASGHATSAGFGTGLPWEHRFVTLIDGEASLPVVLLGLLLALAVGAAHGLAPGHGKAVAAAYLVGDRGRPRDAVALGAVVAGMHTWSVLALGFALYGAARRPETAALSAWLQLVGGVLVLAVGLRLLARRLRERREYAHAHGHAHGHDHSHGHSHDHGRPAAHPLSVAGLVALGAAGGLLPSPSALLVLFSALALDRLAFGLALVGAFSLGLAVTVTTVGLAALKGRELVAARFGGARVRGALALAPLGAAAALTGAGVLVIVRALPALRL